MKQRVITGAVLFAIVLGVFLLREVSLSVFDVFIAVATIFSVGEVSRVFIRSGKVNFMELSVIYAVMVYLASIWGIDASYTFAQHLLLQVAILTLFFVAGFMFSVFSKKRIENYKNFNKSNNTFYQYSIKKSLRTLFIMIYPTMLLSMFYFINHIKELRLSTVAQTAYAGVDLGLLLLIMTFVVTMATDTFAYFVGRTLKGPKLAPFISPKKTISGAIGGLLGAVLTSSLIFLVFNSNINFNVAFFEAGINFWHFALYGVLAGVVSQAGDLFASKIKRVALAKDFSSIFPGHGGFMDRLDGVSFNAVFTFVYAMLIFM